MRSGKNAKKRNKKLKKYIHRYQLSWETERTNLRVTEYRYPPFDRGERDYQNKSHTKKKHKNNVRKTK